MMHPCCTAPLAQVVCYMPPPCLLSAASHWPTHHYTAQTIAHTSPSIGTPTSLQACLQQPRTLETRRFGAAPSQQVSAARHGVDPTTRSPQSLHRDLNVPHGLHPPRVSPQNRPAAGPGCAENRVPHLAIASCVRPPRSAARHSASPTAQHLCHRSCIVRRHTVSAVR